MRDACHASSARAIPGPRAFVLLLAACGAAAGLSPAALGQEPPPRIGPEQPAAQATAATAGLEALFPAEIAGLSFVEGEKAVSTNMSSVPTQNYGCSGDRSLQLARSGQLPGDRPYYAEYVLRVERAGSYELWYGGTPPGPRDEFGLSLSSPLSIVVDGGAPRELYREDVNVVEQYAPAYYWVRAASLDLAEGNHVLRFEVSKRRRLDERWFFYLDALFLADREALAALAEGPVPAEAARAQGRLLPRDPGSRAIDKPFRSIEDYQAYLQANPSSLPAYLELSSIYSLAGDYLSALKTLSKAQAVAPKDPQAKLLVAKNRIWRGEVKEGLEAYRNYLQLRPDDLAGYAEAGKVAAWTGRYPDSKAFYAQGLAAFPGEPSLQVNLGLTQLWASELREAERSFAEAEAAALAAAGAEGESLTRLASIYRNSGYADKALAFYEKAIAARPELLALYLGESEIYAERGEAAAAQAVEERIAGTFAPSPRLATYLASFVARRDLRAERIRDLELAVAGRPEDLPLREELTRVYFWNGLKERAVLQLESILAARFVSVLDESEAAAPELASIGAAASALRAEAEIRLASSVRLAAAAEAAAKSADQARALAEDWEERRAAALAAAEAAAAAVPPPKALPKVPSPEEGEPLRAAAASAVSAAESAAAELRTEMARLAALVGRAAALHEAFPPVADRERELEKGFQALLEASGWSWDPKAAGTELAGPASRGEGMAAYGQARLMAADGDPKAALAALSGDSFAASPELEARRRAAEYEARSRIDYREARELARRAAASADLPAGSALEAAARELALVESALPDEPAVETDPGSIPPGTEPAPGTDLGASQSLAELRRAVSGAQADLAVLAQSCALLRDRRVVRAWHAFEEASAFRRAELGAYYDELGQDEKAAAQYRRVLAVDPGNIPAKYSLALAEDRAGNWREASSLLKAVHEADPDYGSAASIYNRIARLRAPGFDLDASLSADLNRLWSKAGATLRLPLSSLLSLGLRAGLDSLRDVEAGLPAYLAGRLEAEAAFSLVSGAGRGLVLRPAGSLIGTSADYGGSEGESVSPEEFLGSLNLFTAGALSLDARLDARAGSFSGTASYRWEPLFDTLDPSRFPLYAHRAELAGGAYLPLSGAFRYFAPRIYGAASSVPEDGNFFGTALVELVPAIRLSDSPWANLGFPLCLVYEDAEIPRTRPYYAADQALTAKGGLLWQSTFAGLGEGALSATVQALGGLYQTESFSSSPDRNLYLQLFGRCEWIGSGASYWLSFEAAGAGRPGGEELAYWSLSLLGGISARQPRLIAY